MIYPNRKEAAQAAQKLSEEFHLLLERYGATFEIDDSYVLSWFVVEYLGEDGEKRKFYE